MPTISQLPAATQVNSTDLLPIVQVGVTKKATFSLVSAQVAVGLVITESQVTNLTDDLAARLVAANNLSDLTNASTARTNLGLGNLAVLNAPLVPADGGTGVASPTLYTLPVAQGTGNFAFLGPLTNGQLLIGSTGANPVPAALTAGTNISINNTAGGISISATGSGGFSWNHVTGSTQAMTSNNGYIADKSTLITFTLPTTAALGDEIALVGRGSGGWTLTYTTSQYIYFGSDTTTTTTGSLSSNNAHDCLYLVCTLANNEWTVTDSVGIITIV